MLLVRSVAYKLIACVVGVIRLYSACGLGQHIARRVIGVALSYAVTSRKLRKLTESIIDIAALYGRSVLGAAFAYHAPREVIGVIQRDGVLSRRHLRNEVADLVIGIRGGFLVPVRAYALTQQIVSVGSFLPVRTLDGDKTVHSVIGIDRFLAVRVGHGGAVAVVVIGVADGVPVGLGDRNEIPALVCAIS